MCTAIDFKDAFVSCKGRRVHYRSLGAAKRAYVFIHGWGGDTNVWKYQGPLFEARRCLLIDLPGHGLSSCADELYDHELFARSVEAVLDAEDTKAAVVVGHSTGAAIAYQLIHRRVDRVAAFVSVEGSIPVSEDYQGQASRYVQRLSVLNGAEHDEAVKAFVGSMFPLGERSGGAEEVRRRMEATPREVLMYGLRYLADVTTWRLYPVRVPTLVINSQIVHPLASKRFLERFVSALEFSNWDDVGHFVMIEQADRFNAVVGNFLDRHDQA